MLTDIEIRLKQLEAKVDFLLSRLGLTGIPSPKRLGMTDQERIEYSNDLTELNKIKKQ
jgi:hypothetical protein